MSVSYIKAVETENFEEFELAREQFSFILNELVSIDKAHSEHGDIEFFLDEEGNELIRRMLQGYLDMRSNQEIRHCAVTGEDGIKRTHVREGCKQQLESQFGTVKVTRIVYGKKGIDSLFPLDRELNLPTDKYSHGLKNRAVAEAVKNSFDEGVSALKLTTGGKVPKRQLELLIANVSCDFSHYYESQEPKAVDDENDILVLSADGKGIIMIEKALHDITRKNAERKKKKGKVRLKSSKKKHKKRTRSAWQKWLLSMIWNPISVLPQISSPYPKKSKVLKQQSHQSQYKKMKQYDPKQKINEYGEVLKRIWNMSSRSL